MVNHKIIGTTQYVQLPGYLDDLVPAKVDTGADNSAIWASNINEKDGELSFVLFAPKSVFYTGEVIKTNEYSMTAVKNSFGHSEYRYRIKLQLKIGSSTYKVSFNLADRSHNRFPILIGKRFLKNRFVVDVSKNDVGSGFSNSERPILVLTSRIDKPTKDFFKLVVQDVSSEIILERYRSLRFEINDNNEPRISLTDGFDIANSKVVYFKSHSLFPDYAGAIVKYLQYKHVPFFDRELGEFVSRSKLSEMFILATNGIPVIQSKVYTGCGNVPSYSELKLELGGVFVIKDAEADRERNNYIVSDKKTYNDALKRLKDVKTLIVQRFVENDGFLRVLIMGGNIIQIIKIAKGPQAVNDDPLKLHLNKSHSEIDAIKLSADDYDTNVIAIAHKAALAMERSIVGVDLIQDKISKRWYVLEVNYNPRVVTGIDVPEKAKGLAKLLEVKHK